MIFWVCVLFSVFYISMIFMGSPKVGEFPARGAELLFFCGYAFLSHFLLSIFDFLGGFGPIFDVFG